MAIVRYRALQVAACFTLVGLAACAQEGQDEMSWARAALARNDRIEVVGADQQTRTFTVRVKDTGELRVLRADQLIAGPALAANAPPAAAPAPGAAAPVATAPDNGPVASAGEAAVPPDASAPSAAPARAPADTAGGRVLEAGPGYSIKAASPAAPAAKGGRVRDSAVTSAAVERRHEPIVCQGSRLLHIDNRNLEFEGDAVSAQDGCEIHITNSHISATGVGVTARHANVHIDNSLIEGDTASIDASEGAQVYAASSRFRGLSRRLDSAAFHDLGGNVWN
ncbi:MAG TPA: hypothetical protein VK128_00450 [Steroidobacteraceae bacterium]|nr:hypothetical protein [Steroidobacteraceae bacterium]